MVFEDAKPILSNAAKMRLEQLNKIDEFCLRGYESSSIYKENMKEYHDRKNEKREFAIGDRVLLFESKLKLFLGKLRLRWRRPYQVVMVYPYGYIELENDEGLTFKVNGKKVKRYLNDIEVKKICEVVLGKV